MHDLKDSERIIVSYIPKKEDYNPVNNENDKYSKSKIKNIDLIQRFYKKVKCWHISRNTAFFILEDIDSAKFLNLSNDGMFIDI